MTLIQGSACAELYKRLSYDEKCSSDHARADVAYCTLERACMRALDIKHGGQHIELVPECGESQGACYTLPRRGGVSTTTLRAASTGAVGL